MSKLTPYQQCLSVMYGLHRFGIILGLDVIGNLLKGLNNPQHQYKSIHLAGTNGKGSTAATIAGILQEAGYSVGLYTSPHLVRFNERICINGRQISDQDVVTSYEAVRQLAKGDREPTFFEYTTAMALYEFARQKVDWAVIETGMGGRLDATNILRPDASVITNISLEHQAYLGDTIEMIAGEKAGIIKPDTPVITAVKQEAARRVIHRKADACGAPLYLFGRDFKIRRQGNNRFSYYGPTRTLRNLEINLLGNHQNENAAVALATCEVLMNETRGAAGLPITEHHIRNGLLRTRWPGRIEVVSRKPFMLIDGAHNLAAVKQLTRFIRESLNTREVTLVAGILDDKAFAPMLRTILPFCRRVILTQPKIDRSLPPDKLLPVAREFIPNAEANPDVCRAILRAIDITPPDGAICIAGSLYVVGEAKEAIDSGKIPVCMDIAFNSESRP